jgi:DNA-binding beta-propeller fold protein YncE
MRFTLLLCVPFCAFGCKSKEPAQATEPAKSVEKPAPKPPETTPPPATPAAPDWSRANGYTISAIALPAGGPDGIGMDYLLYNPRTKSVWAPAGNTGSVDVVDVATGKVSRIEGFATQEMERRGKKRTVGPSSATLGPDGTVYVGNRGDFSVCAIDEKKLSKGACGKLDSMPDGISYVAKTNEVWVTTPRDKSVRILDAKTLAQKAKLEFEGEPEGFAPDAKRGRFYTNLEDKDVTLAIDLASHKTVATWKSTCGEDGPHGLRLVEADGVLLVACSTRVETLDVTHDGAVLGSVDTGDGVDDVDYTASTRQVYVGASKAATLTIAKLDPKGALTIAAVVPTKDGSRNGVATEAGAVYLSHSKGSELVVATPPAH